MKAKQPVELERDFARWVADAARMFAWRHAHFRPARTKYGWVTPATGDEGFVDYVLVRPPRLILAELKRVRRPSELSDGQKTWIQQLGSVPGVEAYVWTPDQRDEILLCLALEQSPASLDAVRDRLRERTWAVVPAPVPVPVRIQVREYSMSGELLNDEFEAVRLNGGPFDPATQYRVRESIGGRVVVGPWE